MGNKISAWKTVLCNSVNCLSAIRPCHEDLPVVVATQEISLSQWEVEGAFLWLDRFPPLVAWPGTKRRLPIYAAEPPLLAGDWETTWLPRSTLPQPTDGRSICDCRAGDTRWSLGEKEKQYFLFIVMECHLLYTKCVISMAKKDYTGNNNGYNGAFEVMQR